MSNTTTSKHRTDNTHATFLSCLRNWDDPYLHGTKPVKSVSCMRCEGCGCRIGTANSAYGQFESASENQLGQQNEISSTCSSSSESHCLKNSFGSSSDIQNRHYLCNTHSKINRNLSVTNLNKKAASRAESSLHPSRFQPIVRSKSSVNVPKTINQCVKLTKSRPRPSSIYSRASSTSGYLPNNANNSINNRQTNKRTPASNKLKSEAKNDKNFLSTSVDSDKESIENSKTSIFIPSDTSTSGSATNDKNQPAGFTLPVQIQKDKQPQPALTNQRRMNDIMIQKNLALHSFKSSTSSLIDHDDDLVFEDSLQEVSFDSDR